MNDQNQKIKHVIGLATAIQKAHDKKMRPFVDEVYNWFEKEQFPRMVNAQTKDELDDIKEELLSYFKEERPLAYVQFEIRRRYRAIAKKFNPETSAS